MSDENFARPPMMPVVFRLLGHDWRWDARLDAHVGPQKLRAEFEKDADGNWSGFVHQVDDEALFHTVVLAEVRGARFEQVRALLEERLDRVYRILSEVMS